MSASASRCAWRGESFAEFLVQCLGCLTAPCCSHCFHLLSPAFHRNPALCSVTIVCGHVPVLDRVQAKCTRRYFAHVKRFKETGNALLLHKSLRQRLWSGSTLYCRQLPGIGKLLAERLSAAGVGGLHHLAALDARRIEALTQRNYPFGAPQAQLRVSARSTMEALPD